MLHALEVLFLLVEPSGTSPACLIRDSATICLIGFQFAKQSWPFSSPPLPGNI